MRRVWTLLPLALALGCLKEPAYQCQSDDVCLYEGFTGICDLATASCAYPSLDCQGLSSIGGWVNARGLCVPAPNNADPASSSTGESGGGITSGSTSGPGTSQPTTNDPTQDAESSNAVVTGAESTGDSAQDDSSGSEQTTEGSPGCDELSNNITAEGTVTASTSFDPYIASDSVDSSLATSWFSTGPEGGGGPSVYSWSTVTDRCIERIEVDDNSMHESIEFRTGYGFGSAIVRVLRDDLVVFEETVQLPGTPDGPFTVETGGLLGSRVLIELGGHENVDCGGFSELRVIGGPA
ncbi:MAG: hypothetical protein KUG77_25010 [Nannocystaceae bacterium]|nr:hypothetical protein [Nannocystaceae bacterium]